MDIEALFGPVLGVAMVFLRVGATWMIFPFVIPLPLPPFIRLASGLCLSMALYPMVAHALPVWNLMAPPPLSDILAFAFREMIIGIGLGFAGKWIFTACVASANWIGTQMGFSVGQAMNPEFHEGDTSWANFHGWIALMVYLSIGGHWLTIKALADSYKFSFVDFYAHLTNPQASVELWSKIGTDFFSWMLKLAGPMVVVILLLQAALGILSRFIPQINIWSVSIPITLGVGVFVFSLLSPMYGDALLRLFHAGSETQYLWLRFLGAR